MPRLIQHSDESKYAAYLLQQLQELEDKGADTLGAILIAPTLFFQWVNVCDEINRITDPILTSNFHTLNGNLYATN